ncbi:MAG: HPr family phosphocarrier protein [Rhodospirillaceae bacterium]
MTTLERVATIRNKRGLHARAAAKLAQVAGAYTADVTVSRGGQSVSGTSIMGLMMLAASPGTEIGLAASGKDAAAALDAICELIDAKFEED